MNVLHFRNTTNGHDEMFVYMANTHRVMSFSFSIREQKHCAEDKSQLCLDSQPDIPIALLTGGLAAKHHMNSAPSEDNTQGVVIGSYDHAITAAKRLRVATIAYLKQKSNAKLCLHGFTGRDYLARQITAEDVCEN